MKAKRRTVVIGVDAGSESSGVVIILDGSISFTGNIPNPEVFELIRQYQQIEYKLRVVIEDVAAYSMRISSQIIETCKWLGEWRYRLKTTRIAFRMVVRSKVKTWIFLEYAQLVIPMVEEKIIKRHTVKADGSYYKASHMFVDDKIIVKVMEHRWAVECRKEGRSKVNQYGLKDHSWQALAVATMYLDKKGL